MTSETRHNLRSVTGGFWIYGDYVSAVPYGSGHINDTYCVAVNQAGILLRYILQRINTSVFRRPDLLMENIVRVSEHLRNRVNQTSRRALTPIPAKNGGYLVTDDDGSCWRAYVFIEGARTYDTAQSHAQVFEVARAFGEFQTLLCDLGGPRLHETIPNFHNTPRRFSAFTEALRANPVDRAKLAAPEIDFFLEREPIAGIFMKAQDEGLIPERVTHNDTKINNVLLDDETGKGVCVVDLDTVMPGISLNDFGDLVRTSVCSAAEDDKDLTRVRIDMELFGRLVAGYISGAGDILTPAEVEYLPLAGRVITFEQGLRFLTDYLLGDVYYKVRDSEQNLDRTRTQVKLVREMEAAQNEIDRTVQRLSTQIPMED